tara:strand:- start:354 stop:809 length:456 start_codon:yes stop_codon:yes gene_type:complete
MNLRQLKRMIREEYSNYLFEQDEIGVDVQPDDVDADMGDMGDENAEDTLRQIYDMLSDYFEGGEGEEEMDDVEGGEEPPEDVEGTDEEEADLEEWTGKNDKKATTTRAGKYGAAGYKNFSKTSGHTGFGDAGGSKKLNEIKRMKKLANIIK